MDTRRRRFGFTLVELLVVIGIVGLLITLLVPTISGAMRMVRAAMTRSVIKNLTFALHDFRNDHGAYPPSKPKVCPDPAGPRGVQHTGAANLVYYLGGPTGRGWGQGGGGLMPFSGTGSQPAVGSATRTYGPYYESTGDRVRYEKLGAKVVPSGYLDAFEPGGVILYFRPWVDTAGDLQFRWEDNNKYGSKNSADALAKTNYAMDNYFWNCVRISKKYSKWMREDFLLVSPGADGRYGPVRTLDNGEIVPCLYVDSQDYDDLGNWN